MYERERVYACVWNKNSLTLFVPCLLAVWNCDKLPVSGCNPRSHVHCISHTGCLLHELHYLDLKSCCLWSVLSAFSCGWVVSLVTPYLPIGSWSGFALGGNLPANVSYVVWQTSFESSVRKTCHVLVILFLSSGWWAVKGVGIQGGNAKMYHSIKGLLYVLHLQV